MRESATDPRGLKGPLFFSDNKQYPLRLFSSKKEVEALARELSKSTITTYSRFDMDQKAQGRFVVDAYIVGPDLPLILPLSKEEALNNFRRNIKGIEEIGLERLAPEWELIHDNQQATVTYYEEEERLKRGEKKMDYGEYLNKVDGVEPQLIPWDVLDERLEKVFGVLDKMGLEINRSNPNSIKVAFRAYQLVRTYKNPLEIIERFKYYDEGYRFYLGKFLGKDLRDIEFNFVWTQEDAFWRFWERVGMDQNVLYANWHKRQRGQYREGVIEMYAIHEPVHFIFCRAIKDEILKGNLDPAVGVLPIPSPACYQLEGIAQTVSDFTAMDLGLDGKFAIELYRLEKYALTNGLYLLETDDSYTIDDIENMISRYMPFKNRREIRKLLKEGLFKPFERAYLPIYGLSDYFMESFIDKADSGQQEEFFRLIHTTFMTPSQIQEAADEILKAA